jgi:hypothetical protein
MNPALIEKIRKLRALSRSTNVNEAAAAAAAAERLVQEHRISEAELDVSDGDEAPTREQLDELGAQIPSWKSMLSVALAKHHGCAVFNQRRAGDRMWRSQIIGQPSDVATVRYLYVWIVVEIERLCDASSARGRTERNSFRLGAVLGLKAAISAAVREVRAVASSTALVKLDARLAAAEAQLPSKLGKRRRLASAIDPHAFAEGERAGRAIHVGKQLGDGGSKLLGRGA